MDLFCDRFEFGSTAAENQITLNFLLTRGRKNCLAVGVICPPPFAIISTHTFSYHQDEIQSLLTPTPILVGFIYLGTS